MRKSIALTATCVVLVLCMAAFVSAQSKDLNITKGPTVENVTGNSATIAWSTNTSGSTVLKYGTDRNNLNQTAQAPWGGLTHRVTLKNLDPNKTYYYQVTSAQGSGTGSGDISAISQFQTKGGPASASNQGQNPSGQQSASNPGQGGEAQVLVGPIMQKVTENSAVVYWETTKPTENLIKYGTSPNQLTQTAEKPFGGETHKIELTNLQPNTLYHFAIQKPDGTVRTTGYFKTNPPNAAAANPNAVQIIDGPNVEYLTPNQAIIAWSTNAPSSSVVKYGQDSKALNQTAQAQWGGTTHRVTINNLQPNTRYWFSIESGQARGTGTMAQTAPYAFQTVSQGQSAMTFKH